MNICKLLNERIIFYIIVIHLVISCSNEPESQWKGINRNSIYSETGLLQVWPEEGPELLWRFDSLFMGHSSPAVTNDAIYITGMPDSTSGYLFCLNHKGEQLWKDYYGEEYLTSYTGSRSTPTIIKNHLYLLSGKGDIFCYDLKKRKKIWEKSFQKDFYGTPPKYGYSESLLVNKEKVFCTPGGEKFNVVCLNRINGELIWSSEGQGDTSSYSSPILINHNQREILVVITEKSILGFNSKDGNLLWSVDYGSIFISHVNTPLYSNGIIYMGSESHKSDFSKGGLVAIQLNEDGSEAKLLWKRNHRNLLSGFIVKDSLLFTSTYRSKEWCCYNAMNGDTLYTWNDIAYGTLTYSDGRFYALCNDGMILLCDVDGNEFKTISQFKLDINIYNPFAPLWTPPVIKNKTLYIRHKKSLFAYDIEEKLSS